jgi:hypothetical protein
MAPTKSVPRLPLGIQEPSALPLLKAMSERPENKCISIIVIKSIFSTLMLFAAVLRLVTSQPQDKKIGWDRSISI